MLAALDVLITSKSSNVLMDYFPFTMMDIDYKLVLYSSFIFFLSTWLITSYIFQEVLATSLSVECMENESHNLVDVLLALFSSYNGPGGCAFAFLLCAQTLV
jgi:hypothetical protein